MPLLQVIVSQKAASRCVFAEADAEEGVLEGLNLWAPVKGWQWKVSGVFQKTRTSEYFSHKVSRRVDVSRNGQGVYWRWRVKYREPAYSDERIWIEQ